MSSTIPLWLQVVMWLVPLVVTLVATALQVRGEQPSVARRLFVASGILFLVALELTLVNLAEAWNQAPVLAALAQLLALSLFLNVWMIVLIKRGRSGLRSAESSLAELKGALQNEKRIKAMAIEALEAER